MRDSYRYNIILKHLELMKQDEYHIPRITGGNIAPINLDEDVLQLIADYYKGKDMSEPEEELERE